MAEIVEGGDYSSPAKRLKLDHNDSNTESNIKEDLETFVASPENVRDKFDGDHSISSEALNSGDSGFNEFSPTTSGDESQPVPSIMDVSGKSELDKNESGDADDRDEVSSTVSNISDLSGLSDLSGQEWKPITGPMSWVQRQMVMGADPRELLSQLVVDGSEIPHQFDNVTLWKIIVDILSEPPRREKLRHINSLADVVRLLRGAKNVIVLTGAGVSVSCGIPDFRSRDGIYSRLAIDFPDLPDPQAMFDIKYFKQDPRPFFKFAREIYPGQFKPSPCHRFIKALERNKKLLRNYTQNIDTLEKVAGIQNVIECHGSFATASCTRCKFKVTANEIRKDVFAQRIPMCPKCSQSGAGSFNANDKRGDWYRDLAAQGVMKPDIVFFGEGLPEKFHHAMAKDKEQCDLLIVIGSSLKVRPVALIPSSIPSHVPQILINREQLRHLNFDVELLGDSDVIINQLCHMLGDGWKEECWTSPLEETRRLNQVPRRRRRKSSMSSVDNLPILKPNSTDDDRMGHCATDEVAEKGLTKEENGDPNRSRCIRDRHASLDSTGSARSTESSDDGVSNAGNETESYEAPSNHSGPSGNDDALMNCWQPKIRESLASRLQENSFYHLQPNRYIFPGAEVYYDPDEEQSSDSCDSDNDRGENSSSQKDDYVEFWEGKRELDT
ncbi:NAD-dependent protein deacetylase sirtuin-1 [Ischnura elegans]|uniref:NAD-dependent protein deacetylase sirtuin-1 n=1 Tax=Ischnura elegans TaxID=197161 RepID=UPI001ED880F7|nr:NAD-dependent protein deacetylase sirtuin-1 [Ischnura elegans]